MYNFILIKKHFFQQIMGIISNNYKKKIIILSVFPYLLLISDLITPFIYGLLIDEVMLKKNIFLLKWILIVYFCAFCFDSLVRYCQKKFQIKTYNNLKLDLRLKMWFKYLNAPFEFYRKNEIGDLKERIDSDVDKIEIFLNEQIINSIYLLISMVIYMVIIFNISIILALVSLFIMLMLSWDVMIPLCHADMKLPGYLSWNVPFDGAVIRPITEGISSYIHALPAL